MPHSHYQIDYFSNGSASLKDLELQETMHSTIGPWTEAHQVYISPSQLALRLTQTSMSGPLVLYDLGLGIAANALCALQVFQDLSKCDTKPIRDLHLISFEKDLKGIELALQNPKSFPYLLPFESLLHELLEQNRIEKKVHLDSDLIWELRVGDFRETIREPIHLNPCPDLIYYDLYSPKSCPELWGLDCFELLYNLTKPHKPTRNSTILCTYSASTSIRAALLLAGFYVGRGAPTEGKRETTVASTHLKDLDFPLDQKWLEHWLRSSKPLPHDLLSPHPQLSREQAFEILRKRIADQTREP